MYSPDVFRSDDPAIIEYLLRRYNFATLITNKGERQQISHLPFLLDAKAGMLYGHMSRENPQWQDFDSDRPVMVLFQGPHAYVSPRWYQAKDDNVPTWNYAVAHARGVARVLKDEVAAFNVLLALIDQHDPDWAMKAEARKMLPGIVVFEIEVLEVEAKLKLSQNREAEDYISVCENLMKSDDQADRETGALMKIVLERAPE